MGLALSPAAYWRASAGTGAGFLVLWQGMQGSQQGNSGYLNEIASRTTQLDGDVKAYTGKPAMQPVPALLNRARALSAWPGLDPDSPPLALVLWSLQRSAGDGERRIPV